MSQIQSYDIHVFCSHVLPCANPEIWLGNGDDHLWSHRLGTSVRTGKRGLAGAPLLAIDIAFTDGQSDEVHINSWIKLRWFWWFLLWCVLFVLCGRWRMRMRVCIYACISSSDIWIRKYANDKPSMSIQWNISITYLPSDNCCID